MTAVLMLDRDKLKACCEEASSLGVVQICNYNCPGQLVIGGEKAAVDRAAELAKEAGAKRCLPLKVSGPFHTILMHPAAVALAERFQTVKFAPMRMPVLFNCLGHEKAPADPLPICWCGRSRAVCIWRTPSAVWRTWVWTPWWKSDPAIPSAGS